MNLFETIQQEDISIFKIQRKEAEKLVNSVPEDEAVDELERRIVTIIHEIVFSQHKYFYTRYSFETEEEPYLCRKLGEKTVTEWDTDLHQAFVSILRKYCKAMDIDYFWYAEDLTDKFRYLEDVD